MSDRADIEHVLRTAAREAAEAEGVRPLAARAGLMHASLSRFIRGQRSLRLDRAADLAAALGFELTRKPTKSHPTRKPTPRPSRKRGTTR